jgi:hypothetical protein
MEASTTIVNVNPDQLEKFMEFLSGVVGQPCGKPPADLKAFTKLLCTHCEALVAGASEKDAEGCFQVLFKDIQLERDSASAAACVADVIKAVSGPPAALEAKPALRLRILSNLFNVLSSDASAGAAGAVSSSPRVFLAVLLAIVEFAGKASLLPMLNGYFDLLDDLVLKWRLGKEDARALFLKVSEALDRSPAKAGQAQLFLIKVSETRGTRQRRKRREKHKKREPPASCYSGAHLFPSSGPLPLPPCCGLLACLLACLLAQHLATYGAGDAVTSPGVTALAAKGAAGAVRSPITSFMERHNLLGLPAVSCDRSHGP